MERCQEWIVIQENSLKKDLLGRLKELFEDCYQLGKISPSWLQTRMVLVPKKGKDLSRAESYRPVSMINIDYKNFASLWVARLNTFLSRVYKGGSNRFCYRKTHFFNFSPNPQFSCLTFSQTHNSGERMGFTFPNTF